MHPQGVASGDPFATSVILWTRVTPPAAGTAALDWAVSTNKAFTNIVAQGSVTSSTSVDYTAKVA
jgi:alkaline phosphatase D